ncbi:MAG: DMT family transporter [Actinomycetota bacterium]|nr:DMT family transporter [Actinomycetota bacterium]
MQQAQGDIRASRASGFLLVALAAALWGSDALFRRGLALELPAATVVFVEHLILVVFTLPLLVRAIRAARSFTTVDWVAMILVGAGASALATVLFTAAFRWGEPNTPLLLQKLQPLVAVLGARMLLGERLLPRYAAYFLVAMTGAYLVTFPDPGRVTVARLAPALLALGAAALWGMGTVLGRHLTAKMEVPPLTALRFGIGLAAGAVIVVPLEGASAVGAVRPSDLPALFLLAMIPGLLALLLYYRGLGRTPAAAATLAELAFPLAAVSINFLAFGATLSRTQWLGLALLAGTITIMGLQSQRSSQALGVEPGGRMIGTRVEAA